MAEDRIIDAALRDVPVPAGIGARTSVPALFGDAAIDRLLADVAVPAGLAERLRSAVLDSARGGGVVDLDRIGSRPGPAPRPARLPSSTAGRWLAALARDGGLVALSLCGIAAVFLGGMALSRRLERGDDVAVAVAPRPMARDTAPVAVPLASRGVPVRPALVGPVADVLRPSSPGLPVPPPNTVPRDPAGTAQATDPITGPDEPPAIVRGAPLAPTRGAEHQAAGMRFIDLPSWCRRGVPRVRGYDLAFELAHGEAPFVDPAADPALTVDRPPLTLRTDTFDAFRLNPGRRAEASGRPLRVEHVLAALPAAPAPTAAPQSASAALRLDTCAVRSLRKVVGVQSLLVEACITAPPLDRPARDSAGDPLDATIVLDRAVGGARLAWPWICRALATAAAQMGPRDRLTVVVAGPEPQVALRRRGAAEVASLAAALERLSPTGFADLHAALDTARTVSGPGSRFVVVAQAGSLDRGGDDVRAALAAWRQSLGAAPRGIDAGGVEGSAPCFVILDAGVAGESATDPAAGSIAAEPVAIRRALLHQLFATSTLVARQCRLDVAFDPGQVAAYRLVGHRQSVVDSLDREPSPPIDLHAGETVRVVYEVLPRPGSATAAGNRLATATLSWRSPADATPREARATISGGGPDVTAPLPSAHGCELLLAVGLGDIAGESAHVGRRGTTATALASVANGWQARGDVTPCGAMLMGCLERWAGDHHGTR